MPVITLLTDFGLQDAYVGTMKGVILGLAPMVQIVDLCHLIPPQDIQTASFVLDTAVPYFPPSTVHVVVVDPGVGGERRPIAVQTPLGTFVGPDNGVFSAVLARAGVTPAGAPGQPVLAPLPPDVVAVHLNRPAFWLPVLSATFHGRDLFAPVAAHLARGVALADLGDRIDALVVRALPRAVRRPDGTIVGPIVHVDHFGNLITAVTRDDLAGRSPSAVVVTIAGRTIRGLVPSYSAGQGLIALIGSSGRLEIAVRDGSAAALLGARVGDEVLITWA